MLSTLYIFIAFFIVGRFSSPIENTDKNLETYRNLIQLLSNSGKLKISNDTSDVVIYENARMNLTVITFNNFNHHNFNGSIFPGLDDQCIYNKDCHNIPYSQCSLGKCSCKHNYLALDGKCKGLIEEACEEDSDCALSSSICYSGYCACKIGFYSSDNSKCYRFAKEPGDFCEDNQGCHEVKHSTCSENSCECKSNYRQQEKLCLGLIDAKCSSDQECAIKNSTCQHSTCQCISNSYLEGDICYEYAESLNNVCLSEETCKHLPYTSCNDGHCLCLPSYVESSGRCLGMINKACKTSADCVANNAVCDGTCQCPNNYYFENEHCYKFADRPFSPVASAQACQHLENTVFATGRCECLQGYYHDKDHCYKIPSDYQTPVDTARACEYLVNAFYFSGRCYAHTENWKTNKDSSDSHAAERFFWIRVSNDTVPSGTVTNGHDNILFVCRASHEGDMIPGKLSRQDKVCYVPWGDKEFAKSEYQVLLGSNLEWKKTSDGNIPSNAIFAGKTKDDQSLYICRVHYQNTVTIGKVHAARKTCYIPYCTQEISFKEYEILTEP